LIVNKKYNRIPSLIDLLCMKFFYFFLILVSFVGSSNAQDLKAALSSAYDNNPDLKASREKLKATDEQIMQSLSRWLPTVAASKQKRFLKQGSSNGNGSAEVEGVSGDLSITQNLFRGGSDIATIKMAKSVIAQERAALLNKEQEVLVSAVDIYMKTLQAEEEYKIAEEQLQDSKLLVRFAQKRFAAGESTKTDVAQAKSSLAEAHSALISTSSNLEIIRSRFFEVTGVKAHKLIDPNLKIQLPQTLDQSLEYAMINNPEIIMARQRAIQLDHNIDKVRGEKLLPSIDLKHVIQDNRRDGQIGISGLRSGALNRVTVLSLSVPIFDGGASWSQYRQAKRTSQQSKYDMTNVQNKLITSVTSAWREYEAKKYILESKKEEVSSSRIAYKGMKKEERAGLRSIGDVIIARSNYFNSYRRMLNAKSDYETSRYVIAAKVGGCTAEHLKLDVKLYDPFKNYNIIKLQPIGSYNPK